MSLKSKLKDIHQRIENACLKSGRKVSDVTLVCVSNTIDAEIIKEAVLEGEHIFGENRPQELRDKFDIVEKDGGIFLCPVIVYPKDKLLKIAKIIKESEVELSGEEGFQSVEDMFLDMGIDVDNV